MSVGADIPVAAPARDADSAQRHQFYRENGWWSGEDLLARYLRLSAPRLDELAVADSRGRSLTHRQLLAAMEDRAAALVRCGVRPGDVVLMAMPNWVEWHVLLLAMLRVDAIPATIPVRTDPAHFRHVVDLIGARLLIVPSGDLGKGLEDVAVDVARACAHALNVLTVAWDGGIKSRLAEGRPLPHKPGQRDLDHIAFTSSTTGPPKSVMHSADTLAALNIAFSQRFALDRNSPIFMASPLGHSVGSYHGPRLAMFNASPLVLQDQWDPEVAIGMIQRHRCAFTAAATPFLNDLVNAPAPRHGRKLDSMRWFLCGGAQVPPVLMDRASEEFPKSRVTVLWGMTEGGLTTCHDRSPPEKFRSTCGVGLPGLEIHTIDESGEQLPPGAEGELVMRGPGVFFGYLGQDDLYRSLVTPQGFFRTGDLAIIDDEGYLRITGRVKDLIIRGGVNISPVPIENALAMHPDIASVAVIGAPDDRLGERLCAVVQPRGRCPDLAELQRFVRDKGLPKYLTPESMHVVADMPRTAAGKIRKVDLRRQLESALQKT